MPFGHHPGSHPADTRRRRDGMHALLYSQGIQLIVADPRVGRRGYALYDRIDSLALRPGMTEDEEIRVLDDVVKHWQAILQRRQSGQLPVALPRGECPRAAAARRSPYPQSN